ncbi:Rhomboid family protein [Posidoniimonas polymericola]|uniref:Rhomboid family protein n=1 Tax=Posidoniimonas polymericola TaxID=2528002 RepID=A0A5C5YFI8_9BACT|nr:rhomboid family intramembrane serine protease [Posidoniimonas polymericola]TWT73699.1 Rhomboid family protein [Posidoniimonas polymericola]
MFFFFPVSTDAPVYHWPFATVGLIAANILIFVASVAGALPNGGEEWMLLYGEINPLQWLTSAFMHAGIGHLLGNMVFLWVFGLVVEGKIGSLRFLACYLGIAVLESAAEQALFLNYQGSVPGSLGASTAIYGIMAMALVWSPVNEIQFYYFCWFFYFVSAGTFEAAIYLVCLGYVGLDILYLILYHALGPAVGSASGWLHLAGFAIGFPLAIAMLKTKAVDCEGWDMLHAWNGDTPSAAKEEAKNLKLLEKRRAKQQEHKAQLAVDAHEQLALYLQNANGLAALKLLEKLKADHELDVELTEPELVRLIPLLHQAGKYRESAAYMARLIELRGDQTADPVRLKLAQICVVELGKPARAMDLLHAIDAKALPAEHLKLAKKIAAKARVLQQEGELELDDGVW